MIAESSYTQLAPHVIRTHPHWVKLRQEHRDGVECLAPEDVERRWPPLVWCIERFGTKNAVVPAPANWVQYDETIPYVAATHAFRFSHQQDAALFKLFFG